MPDFLDALTPYLKPFGVALVVVAVVWGFTEYAMFWAADHWRRMASVFAGQAVLFWVHRSDVYSFGDGPEVWAVAMLCGMAAAPLASVFHDQLIARFLPGIKAEQVGVKIQSLMKGS